MKIEQTQRLYWKARSAWWGGCVSPNGTVPTAQQSDPQGFDCAQHRGMGFASPVGASVGSGLRLWTSRRRKMQPLAFALRPEEGLTLLLCLTWGRGRLCHSHKSEALVSWHGHAHANDTHSHKASLAPHKSLCSCIIHTWLHWSQKQFVHSPGARQFRWEPRDPLWLSGSSGGCTQWAVNWGQERWAQAGSCLLATISVLTLWWSWLLPLLRVLIWFASC